MSVKSVKSEHPSWYIPVLEVFDDLSKCLEEKISKEKEQLEACKKKTELLWNGKSTEMYQIDKELTGIRFDFTAPPNVAKGYIKSDSRKLLQPFEAPEGDSDALWSIPQSTAAPIWTDKENHPKNH